MSSNVNKIFNDTVYGKGYFFPKPLINKLSIISALQDKFKFISLTLDLLQEYPDLFNGVATNLIYILQTGMSYKNESILEMFGTLMSEVGENSSIEIQSLPILYGYYMWKNNEHKFFEPAMKPLYEAMEIFLNNPYVYYNNMKLEYKLFKPLCQTMNGDNLFDLLPYLNYVFTFYSDCSPYKFFEEIGSESSYNNLMTSINNYFGGFYKNFLVQLGLSNQINLSSNFSELNNFLTLITDENKITLNKTDVKKLLISMLQLMLNEDSLIELRNSEMNKSKNLLDDNFSDQNRLSDNYIIKIYEKNFTKLISHIVEISPFKQLIDSFPQFKPLNLSSPTFNLNELLLVTQYCLYGENKSFWIDNDLIYQPFITKLQHLNYNWDLETKINRFLLNQSVPFSDCDNGIQILISILKQKIISTQENIFNLSSSTNEEISVFSIDNIDLQKYLFNYFINGLFANQMKELNFIVENLPKTNLKFKEDIENILNLVKIAPYVYENIIGSHCIGVFLYSFLPSLILHFLEHEKNLNNFNLYQLIMKYIVNGDNINRITKITDIVNSILLVKEDSYARLVNSTINDVSKFLLKSHIFIPYLIGNNDDGNIFSIGGINLYDKMIDKNPLNRGYYFLSSTFGLTPEIVLMHQWTSKIEDKSILSLMDSNSFSETVMEILTKWHYSTKSPQNLMNYNFEIKENQCVAIKKENDFWVTMKIGEKYVFQILLEHSFNQIIGSYVNNQFKSKEIKIVNQKIIPYETSNGFIFNGEFYSVSINGSNSYYLPIYKYQGEFKAIPLSFANPPGYKLINLVIDSPKRLKNSSIFLFTSVSFDNSFNFYFA